jgi:hypothetical protein
LTRDLEQSRVSILRRGKNRREIKKGEWKKVSGKTLQLKDFEKQFEQDLCEKTHGLLSAEVPVMAG